MKKTITVIALLTSTGCFAFGGLGGLGALGSVNLNGGNKIIAKKIKKPQKRKSNKKIARQVANKKKKE